MIEERDFLLKDENGETFTVDFYTDANIDIPSHALETNESFGEWLKSFVVKKLKLKESPLTDTFLKEQ